MTRAAPSLFRKNQLSRPRRRGELFFAVLLATCLAQLSVPLASRAGPAVLPQALIVKYRGSGDHALEGCAEKVTASAGRSFAAASRDGSDSLDRLQSRFGLGRQRAVFRRARGESLARRRARLEALWTRRFEWQRALRSRRSRGSSNASAVSPLPEFPDLAHVYRVVVPAGVSAASLQAAFENDPHVEYVQPDHRLELDQSVPFDDPYLTSSGAWGQDHPDLWGPARIGADRVWARSQGEGVVVAIVDTGVDTGHPDIRANLWVNPGEDLDGDGRRTEADLNGLDDDGNGYIDDLNGFDFANSIDKDEDGLFDGPDDFSDGEPFDDNGHGTHIAGTIAAVGGNGEGIVGIAPRARIMALKGFPGQGSASDGVLWQAVLYAAENGARVVNNSWSCGVPCPSNPLAEEVLGLVERLGLVVVTSAGNRGEDVAFQSPENRDGVITVGALGVDDEVPGFSNRGWLVDLVAPGGGPSGAGPVFFPRRNILSLLSSGTIENQLPFSVGEGYLRLSGTSMAAPHVVGAIALLLSERPDLSPFEVRQLLRMSSEDLGPAGHDPVFGAGLLAVDVLLDEVLPEVEFRLEGPQAGLQHDPRSGPFVLRGVAEGPDLERLVVEIGAGLSPSQFVPLESFGGSGLESRRAGPEAGVLARWAVESVTDGPYVLRVRAELRDGRSIEEHQIIAIERNRPLSIALDPLVQLSRPAIAGRRVLFQIDESEDSPTVHDLAVTSFASRRQRPSADSSESNSDPVRVVTLEGDQREAQLLGSEMLWVTLAPDGRRLEHCRLSGSDDLCEPSAVTDAPNIFDAFLGRGSAGAGGSAADQLVWVRLEGRQKFIEGCRLGPGREDCRVEPLVSSDPGTEWRLLSSDGKSLILVHDNGLARCLLEAEAGPCVPVPISRPAAPGLVTQAWHDGALLAYTAERVLPVVPEGCDPFDSRPGCSTSFTLMSELNACWIDDSSEMACLPTAILAAVRQEDLHGIALSGRRIVWSRSTPTEEPAIYFCEFQPQTGTCPVQRLGGAAAAQTTPAIDGPRVVWQDARYGKTTIQGLELPRLIVRDSVVWKSGQSFSLPLRGVPGSSGDLVLSLEAVDGDLSPSDARARVWTRWPRKRRQLGPDLSSVSAALVGRIPTGFRGEARWRLRVKEAGGLSSEKILSIRVEAPSLRGRWNRWNSFWMMHPELARLWSRLGMGWGG